MSAIILIIFIFAISVIIGILKSPKFIGFQGEKFVQKRLISALNPEYYTLINDVMLPSDQDINTTQIDHIIISNFGIFCVETKSFSGWIFGNSNDKYWTQSINYNKYRFFNPLRQNYGHVKTLKKLLTSFNIFTPIYSFVIFPNAEELKITGTDTVGYTIDIIHKIKEYEQLILSNEDKEKIINIILQTNIVDKNIRREHVLKINKLRDAPPQVLSKKRYKGRQYQNDDDYEDYDDDCDDDF